jgi:mRNA interferase MazF
MKAPQHGAIIKLNFNPQQGHEQAGFRSALVVSNSRYNASTGMMVACPISSKVKGYGFEVLLPDHLQTSGVVLVNQIKALDWQSRGYTLVEQAPAEIVEEVLEKIIALLEE